MIPSRRKRLRFVAAGFVLAGSLVLAVSWVVGSKLLEPARGPVSLPKEFEGTEVSFSSGSGATLRGNFLKGSPGKGVVVLMHGVRGNRGAMADHALFLRAHGFSILLFDFQAHGESSGEKITSGYLESMDAAAAVEFARKIAPREKIGVLGVSLGGAAALLADPPLPVDAVVLELVYDNITHAVKNRIALVLGDWARPFSPLLTWQMRMRAGVSADWFSPERAIGSVDCPKLIIAGGADRHTRLSDSEALFNAAASPKEMWVVEKAAHENIHAVAGAEYEQRVAEFFSKNLAR